MVSLFGCSNGQMEGSIEVPIVFGGSGEKSKIKDLYELQERCGKRCEDFIEREYRTKGVYVKYENHYNRKLNRCFVLIKQDYTSKDENNNSMTHHIEDLYDVNEHKYYGHYSGFWDDIQDDSISCKVLDKRCKSKVEWNSLVKPYMTE